MNTGDLMRAASMLAAVDRVVVSTGAGMSAESGIPTFRDAQQGMWAKFDPEELATEQGFRAAPARVWSWYQHRRRQILESAPHAGHVALVELERLVPELTVVTQNIDGLHQAAGSVDVVELHGNIHRVRCLDCAHPAVVPADASAEGAEQDPPRCTVCGSWLRPDVVWFGELLPEAATERAWAQVQRCQLLLVVGTSGVVWPAAELPHLARRHGARILEVNAASSEVTPLAHLVLQGSAGEVLPRLVEAVAARRSAASS